MHPLAVQPLQLLRRQPFERDLAEGWDDVEPDVLFVPSPRRLAESRPSGFEPRLQELAERLPLDDDREPIVARLQLGRQFARNLLARLTEEVLTLSATGTD